MKLSNDLYKSFRSLADIDENILTFFIHGSFANGSVNDLSYQEIRSFRENEFLYSLFLLRKIKSDIDIICVSRDVNRTQKIFTQSVLTKTQENYITINLIGQSVFEKEVVSDAPKAIKRILSLKKCFVVKGEEFFQYNKHKALKKISQLDVQFNHDFESRKEYLGKLIEDQKEFHYLSSVEYFKLFPRYVQFIRGEIDAGFPEKRSKLVFPEPLRLKMNLNLNDGSLQYLE